MPDMRQAHLSMDTLMSEGTTHSTLQRAEPNQGCLQ